MIAHNYLAYTYLIGWTKHNKWYYGIRYAEGCDISDLWSTYFTSSTKMVPLMRTLYGEPDIIQIRRTFDCVDKAREWEYKVLRRMKVVKKFDWLNKSNGLIPPVMKGENHPRYGKSLSIFSKRKISKANKNNQYRLGQKHSIQSKKLIGEKSKLKYFSDEYRNKLSKSKKGKKNPFYGKPSPNRKPVKFMNVIYNSITAAAIANNIHKSTMRYWLKIGKAEFY